MTKPHEDRRIDYVELNVADIARSKAFYGAAFGWTFTDYGPDYCEFSDGHMKGGFDATLPVTIGGPLVILYGDDLADIQSAYLISNAIQPRPNLLLDSKMYFCA